jgi:Lipopolysaccharide export system permease LptF/LptG
MMMPGRALHRLAARICSAKALERVVEPAIADLQKEHVEAGNRSAHRQAWVFLAGYLAVLKVIALAAVTSTFIATEDRYVLGRTFAVAAVVMMTVTTLMVALPMAALSELATTNHVALVLPQALPLSLPLGLMVGIAYGAGGRIVSPATIRLLLLAALTCSIVSLGSMLWIMPASSGWNHHIRFALPCAALVLTAFSLATARRGALRGGWMVAATCAIYFALLHVGDLLIQRGGAPPFIGPWLPNIVFVAWAGASFMTTGRAKALRY